MKRLYSKELLQEIIAQLGPKYGEQEGESMAYYLIEELLGLSRMRIIMNEQVEMDTQKVKEYEQCVARLLNDEPIQHIFGSCEFYGRVFRVNSNVLIPRSETEELIKIIVDNYQDKTPSILDIGTGSGCIACTLALELKNAAVTGIDVSEKALNVAESNAENLGARVEFVPVDILREDISELSLDIIVSNPPYVTQSERTMMSANVLDYEPDLALFVSDRDPLIFYRTILEKGKEALRPGGKVFFEINEQFGVEMQDLCLETGYLDPKIYKDINGKDRFVSCVWK